MKTCRFSKNQQRKIFKEVQKQIPHFVRSKWPFSNLIWKLTSRLLINKKHPLLPSPTQKTQQNQPPVPYLAHIPHKKFLMKHSLIGTYKTSAFIKNKVLLRLWKCDVLRCDNIATCNSPALQIKSAKTSFSRCPYLTLIITAVSLFHKINPQLLWPFFAEYMISLLNPFHKFSAETKIFHSIPKSFSWNIARWKFVKATF